MLRWARLWNWKASLWPNIGTQGSRIDTVLDAAKLLAARADGNNFRIILLGDGAERLSCMSEQLPRN